MAQVFAGFFKGIAAVSEVLLWAAVGFVLAFVLARVLKQRPSSPFRRRGVGSGSEEGVRLFDLDVSPDSLPPDIPAAAGALLERGDLRGALSLLYRGMLARFVRDKRPDIGPGATEKECLALVRRERSTAESDYFGRLTKEWMRLAYAHRAPEAGTVRALCLQWREVDHDAGG
jgi:hypothetical protein